VDLFVSRYVHVDIDKLPELGSDEKFCRFRVCWCNVDPGACRGNRIPLPQSRGWHVRRCLKKGRCRRFQRYYGMAWSGAITTMMAGRTCTSPMTAGPKYLTNKHDGTFDEVGLMLGADLSGDGQELDPWVWIWATTTIRAASTSS